MFIFDLLIGLIESALPYTGREDSVKPRKNRTKRTKR